jgi:hypothetical protein
VSANPSIDAVLRRAWRVRRLGLAAEATLLAVAAALAALAAGVLSGTSLREPEVWVVAAAAGALAGATWRLAQRATLGAVARAIDQSSSQQGALVTAWECEGDAASGPLARLCIERVRARLDVGRAVRGQLPAFAPPAALVLLCGVALALAFDHAGADRSTPARSSADALVLADGAIDALAQAASGAREGSAQSGGEAGVELVQAVQRRALALRVKLADPARDPAELGRELAALDLELVRCSMELPHALEIGARLAQARTWLDALRATLAERGGIAGAEVDSGLAFGPPDGTMSGPPGSPRPALDPARGSVGELRGPGASVLPAAEPPAGSGSAGERAALGSRWWPVELDPVVTRWIEARRGAERQVEEREDAQPGER